MTDDELRQQLAAALGVPLRRTRWQYAHNGIESRGHANRTAAFDDAASYTNFPIYPTPYEEDAELPDYPSDHNACDVARQQLTPEQRLGYSGHLVRIVVRDAPRHTAVRRLSATRRHPAPAGGGAAGCPHRMTRQSAAQQRLRQQGLCTQYCGRPAAAGSSRCAECRERDRAAKRKRKGFRPWHPGGPGRPPRDQPQRGA